MSWPGTSIWSSEQRSARPYPSSKLPPRSPRIAVVITCVSDVDALRACLAGFAPCCAGAGAELIVASARPASELAAVVRQFREPTYLTAPPTATAAELRRIGLLAASANIVAFLDDFAVERHGWTADLCLRWRQWVGSGGRVGAPSCDASDTSPRPALSVVMPVRNGGAALRDALEAVILSDLPRERWELVVVDDASTDDTAALAAQYADRIVRLPGRPRGPGYARNRGFELTLGDYVTFVNADVMVQSDTLRRSATALVDASDVGAVFGAYDTHPHAKGFVSQYRNLLQHYYLQQNAGEASTFSSACGTVRASVFEEAGGYDEWHFPRRQLEDLELGQRIRRLGHRILFHPEIHSTHLKRWTLRGMIRTEIFDRSVPWMRLFHRHVTPEPRDTRSLRSIKRVNISLTWLAALLAIAGWSVRLPALLMLATVCLTLAIVNNAEQIGFFRRERGLMFAAVAAALDLLYYLASGIGVGFGWIAQQAVGEPRPNASAEAFSEMDVRRWPPVPVRRLMDQPRSAAPPVMDVRPLTFGTDTPHLPGAAAEGSA